jgi:hypothetical protein
LSGKTISATGALIACCCSRCLGSGNLYPELSSRASQKGFSMSDRERFRVDLLGRFRLTKGKTPIAIPPRLRKPRELLQALIAFGGTDVSASVLIDALWPDSEGDAAYHALESGLDRRRQLLPPNAKAQALLPQRARACRGQERAVSASS